MSTDGSEASRRGRSIYEGREPAGRLFRRGEREGGPPAGSSRNRRKRPPFAWSIVFLAVVAIYAIAATVFILHRHGVWGGGRPAAQAPDAPKGAGMAATGPSAVAVDSGAGLPEAGIAGRLREGAREITDLIRDADRMADRGMVAEALGRVERRLESMPGSLDLRVRRAMLLRSMGRTAEARDGFVSVLESDPSHIEAREGLAAVLLDLKDAGGALDAARWALDGDASRIASVKVATRAAVDLGQYAVALGHLRVWIQQDPESVEAQDLLGLCQLRLGEYGKAAFQLSDLILKGRGTEATFLNLVLAYAGQKQSNDVADLLMKAVERLGRARVVAWFGRPDFVAIREDAAVAAVVAQIIEGASPGLSLRLPEAQRDTGGERGIGMTPAPDIGIKQVILK